MQRHTQTDRQTDRQTRSHKRLVRSQASARGVAAVLMQSIFWGYALHYRAAMRAAATVRVQLVFRGWIERSGQLDFHVVDDLSSLLGSAIAPLSVFPFASEIWCIQNTGTMPWSPGALIVMPHKEWHIPSSLTKPVQPGEKVVVGASARWQPLSPVLEHNRSYIVLTTKGGCGEAVMFSPCITKTRAAVEDIAHVPAEPSDVRSKPPLPAQAVGASSGSLSFLEAWTLPQVSFEPCSSYDGSLASHEETYLGSFDADSPPKMSLAGIKVGEANSDISALDRLKASYK